MILASSGSSPKRKIQSFKLQDVFWGESFGRSDGRKSPLRAYEPDSPTGECQLVRVPFLFGVIFFASSFFRRKIGRSIIRLISCRQYPRIRHLILVTDRLLFHRLLVRHVLSRRLSLPLCRFRLFVSKRRCSTRDATLQ